jgi:hypothetical protein
MSDDQRRRPGGMSRYLNGEQSKLIAQPRDFDDAGIVGQWSASSSSR